MGKLNAQGLASGVLMTAIGLFFLIGAFDYTIGSPQRMGPGFVPMIVGAILTLLGLVIALSGIGPAHRLPSLSWRFILAVVSGIAAFALSIEWLGLVPAVMLTAGIASFGDPASRWRARLVLAVVLAAGCWLIFRTGLGLPVPAIAGLGW